MFRATTLMLLLFTDSLVFAQKMVDGFAARNFTDSSGYSMPYRLFVPADYDKSRKYPLVVWLHGAGGRGRDNLKQIMGDQIPGTRYWTAPENQAKYPAFVVVPQSENFWDGGPSGVAQRAASEYGDNPSPQLVRVLGIVDSLQEEFNIDASRLYISGQSFGGYGTWSMITKRPEVLPLL